MITDIKITLWPKVQDETQSSIDDNIVSLDLYCMLYEGINFKSNTEEGYNHICEIDKETAIHMAKQILCYYNAT